MLNLAMRLMAVLAVGAMALAGHAAVNDTLLSFSTPGPDKYADGSTVLDGECYALVWTKTGATFAGFAADGTLLGSDSQVVLFAPLARCGKCPLVVFQLDADTYQGGTFGVYLLDTRLASGKVGGVTTAGVPVAVNGFSVTAASVQDVQAGAMPASGAPSAGLVVSALSVVPADVPQPQITDIRVVGEKVFLKVKGTVPCLQYAAKEVEVEGQGQGEGGPVQGAASTDEEITLVMPAKGSSGMYRVERK